MDFESRFEIKYNLKDFDEIFIKKNILNSTNLNKIYEDRIINSIYFDTNNFIKNILGIIFKYQGSLIYNIF